LSRTTLHRLGRVPELQNLVVAGQQGELFHSRLGQQDPIERIGCN
jgi:hypothetical protein